MIRVGIAAAALALCAAIPGAHAQRGDDFIVQEDSEQGARTGFPGMFDTTTVRKNKMVQSYPWLGVDFGLTDNWSVGTSGLFLFPNLGLNPSLFVRTRYRVHGDGRFTAVIDGSAYMSRLTVNDPEVDLDTITVTYGTVGGNVSLRYNDRHTFTGSLHVARLGVVGEEMGQESDRSTFRLSMVTATHEFLPNNWYSLRTSLIHAPELTGLIDSIGSTAEISSRGLGGSLQRTGVRVLNSFRKGRWLFTVGGIALAAPAVLPWFSISREYL